MDEDSYLNCVVNISGESGLFGQQYSEGGRVDGDCVGKSVFCSSKCPVVAQVQCETNVEHSMNIA